MQEVSCDTCTAACCRANGAFVLSRLEYELHRKKMNLKTLVRPRSHQQQFQLLMEIVDEHGKVRPDPQSIGIKQDHGFYVLLSDCGYLEGNQCSIHGQHPQACVEYEVGSELCRNARRHAGLDLEE